MGNACSGERDMSALAVSRRANPIWAKAFSNAATHTQTIVDQASRTAKQKKAAEGEDTSTDKVLEDVYTELNQISMMTPELLDQLWRKYDMDRDGLMEHNELKALMTDYLGHSKLEIDALIVSMFKDRLRAIGFDESQLGRYMQNPDVSDALNSSKALLLRRFDFWLKDINKTVAKIKSKLDVNNDGKVKKDEFIQKFPAICDDVCNLNLIKETRLRMSSFAPGVKHKSMGPDFFDRDDDD